LKAILIITFIFIHIAGFICGGKSDAVRTVTISLPKKTYKTYEPIELRYEWINRKNIIDSIYMYGLRYEVKYTITDEKGFVYKHTLNEILNEPDVLMYPFFLGPGDTLDKIITLNDFGKRYAYKLGEFIFGTIAYFPPGRYKVYATLNEHVNRDFKAPFNTNEIEFEVEDVDETGRQILELARNEKYSEAMSLYPENYFKEYLISWNILTKITEYMKAVFKDNHYKDTTSLPQMYQSFFETYPNSIYNLGDMFIINYLSVSSENMDEVYIKMNELLQKYPNTLIAKRIKSIFDTEKTTGQKLRIHELELRENAGLKNEAEPNNKK